MVVNTHTHYPLTSDKALMIFQSSLANPGGVTANLYGVRVFTCIHALIICKISVSESKREREKERAREGSILHYNVSLMLT